MLSYYLEADLLILQKHEVGVLEPSLQLYLRHLGCDLMSNHEYVIDASISYAETNRTDHSVYNGAYI